MGKTKANEKNKRYSKKHELSVTLTHFKQYHRAPLPLCGFNCIMNVLQIHLPDNVMNQAIDEEV